MVLYSFLPNEISVSWIVHKHLTQNSDPLIQFGVNLIQHLKRELFIVLPNSENYAEICAGRAQKSHKRERISKLLDERQNFEASRWDARFQTVHVCCSNTRKTFHCTLYRRDVTEVIQKQVEFCRKESPGFCSMEWNAFLALLSSSMTTDYHQKATEN